MNVRNCRRLRANLAVADGGAESYAESEQREHDMRRRERIRKESPWSVDVARKEQLWGQPAGLVAHVAEQLTTHGWQPETPAILEQISRAAAFGARTGQRWEWMPLDRLLAS